MNRGTKILKKKVKSSTLLKKDVHEEQSVAVVVPCHQAGQQIGTVLKNIGPEVDIIICVDDCCPQGSGSIAEEAMTGDQRLMVIKNKRNLGVGGAVLRGYKLALEKGASIIVKLDGDGQMDPRLIPWLIKPILDGEADYVKGNRFFSLDNLQTMPFPRKMGNAVLSFFSKLSTGYWSIFDPTNGFTAIQAQVARQLPMDKISQRFFFESDMLFRLSTLRAVVLDMPMKAVYNDEESNLSLGMAIIQFPFYHLRNLVKRLFYNYILRNFSIATVNLFLGLPLLLFGLIFGSIMWFLSFRNEAPTATGIIMLATISIILGLQLLLSFLSYDMLQEPRDPIHRRLSPYITL